MSLFDDEDVRKTPVHEVGQDLSFLSVDELRERIGILKAEIERLEAEAGGKGASRNAAEAFSSPDDRVPIAIFRAGPVCGDGCGPVFAAAS